jgi:hypothetical protein
MTIRDRQEPNAAVFGFSSAHHPQTGYAPDKTS